MRELKSPFIQYTEALTGRALKIIYARLFYFMPVSISERDGNYRRLTEPGRSARTQRTCDLGQVL